MTDNGFVSIWILFHNAKISYSIGNCDGVTENFINSLRVFVFRYLPQVSEHLPLRALSADFPADAP